MSTWVLLLKYAYAAAQEREWKPLLSRDAKHRGRKAMEFRRWELSCFTDIRGSTICILTLVYRCFRQELHQLSVPLHCPERVRNPLKLLHTTKQHHLVSKQAISIRETLLSNYALVSWILDYTQTYQYKSRQIKLSIKEEKSLWTKKRL